MSVGLSVLCPVLPVSGRSAGVGGGKVGVGNKIPPCSRRGREGWSPVTWTGTISLSGSQTRPPVRPSLRWQISRCTPSWKVWTRRTGHSVPATRQSQDTPPGLLSTVTGRVPPRHRARRSGRVPDGSRIWVLYSASSPRPGWTTGDKRGTAERSHVP